MRLIALAGTSSCTAATLLAGGKIAHTAFKQPLHLTSHGQLTCNSGKGSARAKILQQ
jgi:hypothetical protein